jgi:hypothetical protein
LALSIGGTLAHGYFFAFHLLNIVNNNQLLSGVIKAVTQNGNYAFYLDNENVLSVSVTSDTLLITTIT